MKNKRGQFFLIATLIIVSLVIGLATAVNTIQTGSDEEAFYDLSEEIGFETKRVLDYGVFAGTSELDSLVESYLVEYANYISQEEVLFIYGDEAELRGLFFNNNIIGNIGIGTGPGESTRITIQERTGDEARVTRENGIVNVEISGVNYAFSLREGQNFFFVIIKESEQEGGERFVAKG